MPNNEDVGVTRRGKVLGLASGACAEFLQCMLLYWVSNTICGYYRGGKGRGHYGPIKGGDPMPT